MIFKDSKENNTIPSDASIMKRYKKGDLKDSLLLSQNPIEFTELLLNSTVTMTGRELGLLMRWARYGTGETINEVREEVLKKAGDLTKSGLSVQTTQALLMLANKDNDLMEATLKMVGSKQVTEVEVLNLLNHLKHTDQDRLKQVMDSIVDDLDEIKDQRSFLFDCFTDLQGKGYEAAGELITDELKNNEKEHWND